MTQPAKGRTGPVKAAHLIHSPLNQVNNTALAQVIVLPSPGSSQYKSVFQKILSCHVCYGETLPAHNGLNWDAKYRYMFTAF